MVVTLCSGDLGTYSKELLETLAWMLTNLCRHKSQQAKVEVLKKLVPSIAIMLDCDVGFSFENFLRKHWQRRIGRLQFAAYVGKVNVHPARSLDK